MTSTKPNRRLISRAWPKAAASLLALLFAAMPLVMMAQTAQAQTFTTLFSFDNTDGSDPDYVTLVQDINGDLDGTTRDGGVSGGGEGTVFKITLGGKLTTLVRFNDTDGGVPDTGLVSDIDGNLYGTTIIGGTVGNGTFFKITPDGTMKTLSNFTLTDGGGSDAALIQATDGNFYGTGGGAQQKNGAQGYGGVMRITPSGKVTQLFVFDLTDGGTPVGGLVQASDGNLYGTTSGGGAHSDGTVFRITLDGKMTTLYTFNGTDGSQPYAGLVQASDGNLWGTTSSGGSASRGTVFKITLDGKLTTVHNFCPLTPCTDGEMPYAGLIQATDGNLYGTTNYGGTSGQGAVFKITLDGKLTTLHSFDGTDGSSPYGALVQDTNGNLYGTTSSGGANSFGTVYEISEGLKPFVGLLRSFGDEGSTIGIIGQGFTGVTGVYFDGVSASATFDNVSDTYMTATVPSGALTGPLKVTTFTTTLTSPGNFNVSPQLTGFSPGSGIVGSEMTINGVSLTQTTAVTIGGQAASFTVVSDSEVTATVPAAAKTGLPIVITTLGGIGTSSQELAVAPNISSFSPTSGPVGTTVTIAGTTFTGATKVTFGGVAATSFEVINDSQVDVLVPAGAKTGVIQVTTPGGTGTSATSFTVTE